MDTRRPCAVRSRHTGFMEEIVTHNPRTCVGCRLRDTKSNLVRVVAVEGAFKLDRQRGLPGRGAWVHTDPACLSRALRTHAFSRALRVRNADPESAQRLKLDPVWCHPASGAEER